MPQPGLRGARILFCTPAQLPSDGVADENTPVQAGDVESVESLSNWRTFGNVEGVEVLVWWGPGLD